MGKPRLKDRTDMGFRPQDGSPAHSYGWPAGGTYEPDVAAQWLFDSTSGNIVDEVNNISLSAVGSDLEYEQNGIWPNVNPGIQYNVAPGATTGEEHQVLTGQSTLDLAPGVDMVIEQVVQFEPVVSGEYIAYLYSLLGAASNNYGIMSYVLARPTSHQVFFLLKSDDSTFLTTGFGHVYGLNDGLPHKLRFVLDRSNSVELFVDGVSQGTSDISSLATKTFTNTGVRLAGQYNGGGNNLRGVLYETRITIGNLTNNSGGPGGG